jgi:hypothetical protein
MECFSLYSAVENVENSGTYSLFMHCWTDLHGPNSSDEAGTVGVFVVLLFFCYKCKIKSSSFFTIEKLF